MLDLLLQLDHRHARLDARFRGAHRFVHECTSSAHQLEFGLGFHAAQLVHERRALDELDSGKSALQLDRRLGPGPRADRDSRGRAKAPGGVAEEIIGERAAAKAAGN